MAGAETLADGGAHVLATLAEDPNVRATLNAGGGLGGDPARAAVRRSRSTLGGGRTAPRRASVARDAAAC